MVDHEPRFMNTVDCGPVSLAIIFDIFNKLVCESNISVKTSSRTSIGTMFMNQDAMLLES